MQKITPYLWFDNQAEEAAQFYISVFNNSRITDIQRNGELGPGEPGQAMLVSFELEGQPFIALNGGPQFKFTEAISFFTSCEDQEEVDRLWEKLTADGGEESRCGWLKDKFGVSWQIIPTALVEMLSHQDREKATRAMKAMFEMKKIDIQTMRDAFDGT